jgi:hypothetical protein
MCRLNTDKIEGFIEFTGVCPLCGEHMRTADVYAQYIQTDYEYGDAFLYVDCSECNRTFNAETGEEI